MYLALSSLIHYWIERCWSVEYRMFIAKYKYLRTFYANLLSFFQKNRNIKNKVKYKYIFLKFKIFSLCFKIHIMLRNYWNITKLFFDLLITNIHLPPQNLRDFECSSQRIFFLSTHHQKKIRHFGGFITQRIFTLRKFYLMQSPSIFLHCLYVKSKLKSEKKTKIKNFLFFI